MDKSTFAIIISVIAIFIAGLAAFSLEFDFQSTSFTLGALTLLVTLLVTWQIYNKIEIDAKIQKAIDKQISIGTNTALFVSLAQLGMLAYNRNDKAEAIQSLLNALCVWEKEMKSPLAKEAYNYCITKLPILFKNITFEVENREAKTTFLKAVLKTDNKELIDLITQIKIKKSNQ